MKSNVLVKGMLLLVVVALAAVVYLKRDVGSGSRQPADSPGFGGQSIDDETRVAMGIEGDTPTDTIKTLITGQRKQKTDLVALQAENEALQEANRKLLKMDVKPEQSD